MYACVRNLHVERAYEKLFNEFLLNSTIHGVDIFLFKTIIPHARKLWLIFLVILIVWTQYIIVHLTLNYLKQPTEIHMSTNLMHVSNSPFPALAICSGNKFSKRKMLIYAKEVFEAQQNYSPNLLANNSAEMADQLLVLVGFYVFPYDNYNLDDERLRKLHQILTYMYRKTEGEFIDYPSRDILRNLGPECENLTLRALVFGKPMKTSEMFYRRITSTGVCCMFNYGRISYSQIPTVRTHDMEFPHNARKIKYESSSVMNSVAFVLQSEPDDFTYKELSNDAFQLHFFPPNDYAMIQSNMAGEIFVDHNTIVEIPIQPKFFESSKSIRTFPPSVRYCYFPEEGQQLINQSYYSIDECLLICRMQSQIRYCGCVNPSLPGSMINGSYCNLLDLPCLTRWKSVWYDWHDFDHVHNDAERASNMGNIENCSYCLPTCDVINYKMHVNDLPLRKTIGEYYSYGILKGLSNEKPLAIIRLFFQNLYEQANENVIVDDWIDLLNRYGGIMSLMYGFSLISTIEFFYYLTGKWCVYLRHNFEIKQKEVARKSSIYTLYWQELQPKFLIKNSQKSYRPRKLQTQRKNKFQQN